LNVENNSNADNDSVELVASNEIIIEEDTPGGAPIEEKFEAIPENIIV